MVAFSMIHAFVSFRDGPEGFGETCAWTQVRLSLTRLSYVDVARCWSQIIVGYRGSVIHCRLYYQRLDHGPVSLSAKTIFIRPETPPVDHHSLYHRFVGRV